MAKPRQKKKTPFGVRPVLRTESRASEDAPDNPGGTPKVNKPSNLQVEIERSRSLLLPPYGSETLRDESDQNTNEFVITGSAQNSARNDDDVERHQIESTRHADAQSGSSALTPLDTPDQDRVSPIQKII
jgi:hypothetical protein